MNKDLDSIKKSVKTLERLETERDERRKEAEKKAKKEHKNATILAAIIVAVILLPIAVVVIGGLITAAKPEYEKTVDDLHSSVTKQKFLDYAMYLYADAATQTSDEYVYLTKKYNVRCEYRETTDQYYCEYTK